MNAKHERLVRRAEMASRLGVSTTTLDNMVRRGDLQPSVKVSTRVVGWPESVLLKKLRERGGPLEPGAAK